MSISTTSSRSALVVRGGWDGHQPIETTDLMVPFLEHHGFAVRIADSSAAYADADAMSTTDLIVQANSMNTATDDEIRGLRTAVENGCGFAGWHGGIVDSYRNSADYLQLVGGQFAAHPPKPAAERDGSQEDNFVPYRVEFTAAGAEHPATAGLADFDLVTEQYWVLADSYNEVLATTTQALRPGDPWTRPVVSPAVWTRQWGLGRIFICTPGHNLAVVSTPAVRTLIERGLLWAAR